MKNIKSYNILKGFLKKYITHYLHELSTEKRKKSSETTLLIMDLIVCPYLDNNYKATLLRKFGVIETLIPDIIAFRKHQKYWFIKWENFDFDKELNSKNSAEVYS